MGRTRVFINDERRNGPNRFHLETFHFKESQESPGMDSPIATRFFRELFRHPSCRLYRQNAPRLRLLHTERHLPRQHRRQQQLQQQPPHQQQQQQPHGQYHGHGPSHQNRCFGYQQRRNYAVKSGLGRGESTNESKWRPRTELYHFDLSEEFATYPMVTAEELRARTVRPRKVKMLMRDFIDDSLYNPNYGYFSENAVIFSPGEPFDFPSLRDEPAFYRELGRRYTDFEDDLDAREPDGQPRDDRPLWHTPTELFRPFYGEAIARYLIDNYRLTTYPYDDLIIYEMGAGRGTLMLNILDYIRDADPQVYARTKYRVIEISSSLADLQTQSLRTSDLSFAAEAEAEAGAGAGASRTATEASKTQAAAADRGHADRVEIINRSIFDWNERVPSPCFFLALEVFDNFAHDCIRFDLRTGEPLQARVLVDEDGDFHEFYDPVLDPVAARFLRVRHAATGGRYQAPYNPKSLLPRLRGRLRSASSSSSSGPALSPPEYIPTRLMQFFDVLERHFPAHRLLTSDFHSLPDSTEGLNAPVVQTRYERRTIPVTTPLVHQGFFDIMFPTDFNTVECMYQAITGKLTRVVSHGDFMHNWAYLEDTRTRSGENPLMSYYQNASVMVTV